MSKKNPNPNNDYPALFVVEPKTNHSQSFILLHGLGSSGEKFGKELLETGISSDARRLDEAFPEARFIFPTAKRRRSSAFKRTWLNQWFDIASLEDPSYRKETQYDGLEDSAKYLIGIIHEEMRKVPHVILGGISHGCAMSISLLLGLDFPLTAYLGLSGWLPFQQDILEELNGAQEIDLEDDVFGDNSSDDKEQDLKTNDDCVSKALRFERDLLGMPMATEDIKAPLLTPVFIGHGNADEKVKCTLGEGLVSTIRELGMDVTWKCYDGQGHWYKVPDEIDDILEFFKYKTQLSPSEKYAKQDDVRPCSS